MSDGLIDCIVFEADTLLPASWRKLATAGPIRAFNPGIVRTDGGWIFAYRIVAHDGKRRIGICRLDAALKVVEASQTALSDHVRFRPEALLPEVARQWFADPRLNWFGKRLFVYWNSGWHEPRNCQFLQELDPLTLKPHGHPRELLLRGRRQKLEKNWTFFMRENEKPYAVYSILPHRVLGFSLEGDGDIVFEEATRTDWKLGAYPVSHGGLRGGAPPVLVDGQFWSFAHSVHDAANGYRYAPAVYSFDAQFPFAPVAGPVAPLALGNPFGGTRTLEHLNAAVGEVIYPCGAAREGARWLVSHGINDEYCAISNISHASVLATLAPVERVG
jgi:predicted GH43/DUF377 family glycosyl hydrolase